MFGFRPALMLVWLVVCVLVALRRPFFGAAAILVHFILKEVCVVETYGYFDTLHFYEVMYIATVAGVLLTQEVPLGEFFPRTPVDWGIVGFFLVMLGSAAVNGVPVLSPYPAYKYVDLYFKAMVLYFLLSRLANTPRRLTVMAFALVAATSYLVFLAWSQVYSGALVYARPYWFSAFHDFGLQMVITLPLAGALLAARLGEETRLAAGSLLAAYVAFTWWAASIPAYPYAGIGAFVCLLLIISFVTGEFPLGIRVALFTILPLFVLVTLRSMSRASYLGAALGLMMLGWYHRRRWYLVILALPVVAYAVVHQTERVSARVESLWTHRTRFGEEDTSIDMRKEQMRTAMRIVSSYPLLGIGPRQFFIRYHEWVSPEDFRGWAYTMHSVPLLILTEEGFVGFAVYYGLIVLGALLDAKRAAERARDAPDLARVAVIGAGAFMSFLAWAAYSLGNAAMWTINIYGTVALVVATRRVVDAYYLGAAAAAEPAVRPATQWQPRGPTTEVIFT